MSRWGTSQPVLARFLTSSCYWKVAPSPRIPGYPQPPTNLKSQGAGRPLFSESEMGVENRRGQASLPSSTFPPRNSSITSLLVFHLWEGKVVAPFCRGLLRGRGWLLGGREREESGIRLCSRFMIPYRAQLGQ